ENSVTVTHYQLKGVPAAFDTVSFEFPARQIRAFAERFPVWLCLPWETRVMADNSRIEWTDATWNPVTGCTKISPGCAHCYAETFAERFRGVRGHPYEQGFDLKLWPERLQLPLRWKKPRRIFVNSMSDLFHMDIPDDFISQVFETMQ